MSSKRLNMRYWLLSLVFTFLVISVGEAQDTKKKDKEKDKPAAAPEISEFAGKTFEQWKKELHHNDPAELEVAFRAIVMFPLDKVYTALPDILAELNKDKKVKVD